MNKYSVYVLLKNKQPIYVGCTQDVKRRISQHKRTKDFDCHRVVKTYDTANEAFSAENAILRYSTMFFENNLKNAKDVNIIHENLYKNG